MSMNSQLREFLFIEFARIISSERDCWIAFPSHHMCCFAVCKEVPSNANITWFVHRIDKRDARAVLHVAREDVLWTGHIRGGVASPQVQLGEDNGNQTWFFATVRTCGLVCRTLFYTFLFIRPRLLSCSFDTVSGWSWLFIHMCIILPINWAMLFWCVYDISGLWTKDWKSVYKINKWLQYML